MLLFNHQILFEIFRAKDINQKKIHLNMTKKTMPICCDLEQYKLIEKYAKKRGMINASQAVEKILEGI
jgi:hypothetical protein